MIALVISKAASADLRNIYAYTFTNWGERQADSYLDNLKLAMDGIIAETAIASPLWSRHTNMHKVKQGRHLIVFRRQTDDELLILRVLHESMDIDSQMIG